MSGLHTSPSSFWKKRYPDAQNYLGTKVGVFNGRSWWYATGPVLEKYESAKELILCRLTAIFTEQYCSTIHFRLYMIGTSEEAAIPTIMFFCVEKEPRKKAKKMVEDSGIMKLLPGFRTGHQATQPGVGPLVRPATQADGLPDISLEHANSSYPVLEVYLDRNRPVCHIGMPIFVRQSNNHFRQATANAVHYKGNYVFMTVAHIFSESSSDIQIERDDFDSEYDFGSGTEDVYDDAEDVEATSRASLSPFEEISEDRSEVNILDLSSSSNTDEEAIMQKDLSDILPRDTVETTIYASTQLRDSNIPPNENLEPLGVLIQPWTDQDYALIEITKEAVLPTIRTQMMASRRRKICGDSHESRKVSACTSHGLINGSISEGSAYMRVPESKNFETVYQVNLDSPLSWGDCGTGVFEFETENLIGHIVASSRTGRVAYIMAARSIMSEAHDLLAKSEIQWAIPELVGSSITANPSTSSWQQLIPIKMEPTEPIPGGLVFTTDSVSTENPDTRFNITAKAKEDPGYNSSEDRVLLGRKHRLPSLPSDTTKDLLSTPRWKRIKSESPSNAESTRHLDSSNQYNPQVKNESNDNLDRLEDAKALSQDFDVALEKHSSHQKPYWRRKTGGGNAGLENVKTNPAIGSSRTGNRSSAMPSPQFKKADHVHMSQIVNGLRVMSVFTIHKIQYNRSDGAVEYQLTEALTGKLHKGGAWVRERDLRAERRG